LANNIRNIWFHMVPQDGPNSVRVWGLMPPIAGRERDAIDQFERQHDRECS
jgi:hypothetical protein